MPNLTYFTYMKINSDFKAKFTHIKGPLSGHLFYLIKKSKQTQNVEKYPNPFFCSPYITLTVSILMHLSLPNPSVILAPFILSLSLFSPLSYVKMYKIVHSSPAAISNHGLQSLEGFLGVAASHRIGGSLCRPPTARMEQSGKVGGVECPRSNDPPLKKL